MSHDQDNLVAGDGGSKYVAMLFDKETKAPIPINGTKSAKLRFWYGDTGQVTVRNMTPRPAPNEHIVEYQFAGAELQVTDFNSKLNCEVEIYEGATLLLTGLEVKQLSVRRKYTAPPP